MKKLMLAVCLAFGGATLVNAQQTDPATQDAQTQQSVQDQDQDRQQVSISQLPDAITDKLESQDYSGWTIGKAYKKSDQARNNEEIYIVEMKKGTETKKVKFDKDGNELTGEAGQMDENQGQPHDQGQLGDEQKDEQ